MLEDFFRTYSYRNLPSYCLLETDFAVYYRQFSSMWATSCHVMLKWSWFSSRQIIYLSQHHSSISVSLIYLSTVHVLHLFQHRSSISALPIYFYFSIFIYLSTFHFSASFIRFNVIHLSRILFYFGITSLHQTLEYLCDFHAC